MTQPLCRIILIVLPILFACNNPQENRNTTQAPVVAESKTNSQAQLLTCNMLTDKKPVYDIAKTVIGKNESGNVWNLSEIDTTDYFTIEDYFTNTTTKNRLVIIGGEAGMSAGSADHLLLLFSCTDTAKVIWYEQTGKITAADITDVNGDGIKEIICNTGYVWMGECGDHYRIFNFINGNKNMIFSAQSSSLIGCGRDDLAASFKKGDTLEHRYDCSLQKRNDNTSVIRKIQTVKIYEGGETDEEIGKRVKVIVDTTEVRL
ncbi:MAG TPA: hypothetical protein VIM79_00565 [Niastella sp.]